MTSQPANRRSILHGVGLIFPALLSGCLNPNWGENDENDLVPDPDWTHTHHNDEVEAVTFNDGRVFSGGREGEVISSNSHNGNELWQHTYLPEGLTRDVFSIDDTVLNCGLGNAVVAADTKQGSKKWLHTHHDHPVYEVSAGPDRAYSGDRGGFVIAANLADGDRYWSHSYHSDEEATPQDEMIRTVHYSENKNVVLSAGYDRHVIAADADDGSQVWEFDRSRRIKSVDMAGELVHIGIWSTSSDEKVEAISWETQEKVWSHKAHDPDSKGVQEIHSNNGIVASAGDDHKVVVAEADTGEIIDTHTKHTDAVRSVHVEDGWVLSGSRDGQVILHEINFD
ncbi:WD40 repeat domain-containing protein [Natranaeroarchaeum sulfidigenes]|uniref:WD40/PQQ-like beta propeller repeat containing protein n=1 Tax=Natranaeroarchaeum sulfidigenes TaxID=2784880 RepID=A0A897MRQ8_9EURY|nr:PQQ-binding-like beta-propeller repeat protein [Natranaeroarchaeum sulfidigenes]QSG01703.1 WD40/PQQ-like beta propeller repeat containing protein [Natranaeroarchaeum sulfidigenes]